MPRGKKYANSAEAQEARDRAIARWREQSDGHGQNYEPWLTVPRTPSRGRAHRILGRASEREHHLLSDIEANCLYLLDAFDDVVDIREQYPLLPLERTIGIAEENGLKHSSHPHWKFPVVMTTDFLVTRRGEFETYLEAYAAKPSTELSHERTLEKLEIEKKLWERQSVPWYLITERELPKGLLHNLKWFAPARDLYDYHVSGDRLTLVLDELYLAITTVDKPLSTLCSLMDGRLGLRAGTSLMAVRHAFAMKQWQVDITVAIDPDQPLKGLLRVN